MRYKTQARRLQRLINVMQRGLATVKQLREHPEERINPTITTDITNIERETNFIKCFDKETIVSFPFIPEDPEFWEDLNKNYPEKRAIAEYAIQNLLNFGDIIFFDSGTTILQVAICLSKSPLRDITVVTNNVYILQCLSNTVKELRITGGSLDRKRSVLLEPPAYSFDKEGLNKSFISLTGLSDEGVFCEPRLTESKKQAILATKDLIIFVADHTKVGKTHGQCFISFEELCKENKNCCIITDGNVADTERASFQKIKEKFSEDNFIAVPVAQ